LKGYRVWGMRFGCGGLFVTRGKYCDPFIRVTLDGGTIEKTSQSQVCKKAVQCFGARV